jgi:hypothetical protein
MTAKNLWIAVPTYWTHPSSKPGPEPVVFDHPTPLDEEGTLARTLESFTRLKGSFSVLIVAAAAHPDIGDAVEARVLRLLKPFASRLRVYLAAPPRVSLLDAMLAKPALKLNSYGNIRNVQLIAPFILGADAVVGIDDDEIIEDADFMERAAGHLREGVGGISGPYYDAKGRWEIEGAEELESEPNIFLKKNFFMNRAIGKALAGEGPDGLSDSNVAFGGNTVIPRGTIARVCHDPYIPRGEDYDFVINAAMDGRFWKFCPSLRIVHLPPDSTGSQAADKCTKLVADIRRFIYMREKDRLHRERFPGESFSRDYLMPYPGPYLDEGKDLPAEAIRALDAKYPGFRGGGGSPEALVREAVETARKKAAEFLLYRDTWRQVTGGVSRRPELAGAVAEWRVR